MHGYTELDLMILEFNATHRRFEDEEKLNQKSSNLKIKNCVVGDLVLNIESLFSGDVHCLILHKVHLLKQRSTQCLFKICLFC